jgi:hypothetical protein
MTKDITMEELQQAITDALVLPTPGFKKGETSAPNEARKHNITLTRTRRILQKLCDMGVMEKAKVKCINDWGDPQTVRGYRLKGD